MLVGRNAPPPAWGFEGMQQAVTPVPGAVKQQLDVLLRSVEEVKAKVDELSKKSIAVEDIKREFRCTICHETVLSDFVIATCCSNFFGCYPCSLQYLSTGQPRDCPLCRARLDASDVVLHTESTNKKMLYRFRGADAIGRVLSRLAPAELPEERSEANSPELF